MAEFNGWLVDEEYISKRINDATRHRRLKDKRPLEPAKPGVSRNVHIDIQVGQILVAKETQEIGFNKCYAKCYFDRVKCSKFLCEATTRSDYKEVVFELRELDER